MGVLCAIFLGLAIVATQVLHGGFFVPALAVPGDVLLVGAALFGIAAAVRNPQPAPFGSLAAVLLFGGYVTWRCLQAPDAFLGRVELMQALATALAFALAATAFSSVRARLVFLGILFAAALLQAGFGFVQFAREGLAAPLGWFSLDLQAMYGARFLNRARGLFLNPNHFAWLQVWSALFAIALACLGRVTVIARVVLVYLALVFVAAVVLSGSRGGMAALLGGLLAFSLAGIVVMWATMRRGRIAATAGAVSLVALCLGAGFFVYSSSWTSQGRVDSLQEQDVRELFYAEAFRLFQTEPVLGAGPEMFRYGARAYRLGKYWTEDRDPLYVHNDWLQTLAEYGLLGGGLAALTVALLLGGGLVRFFLTVKARAEGDSRPFSNSGAILLGAFSGTIAFCLHSLVDFNMHLPANALLAGATLGLLAGGDRPRSRRAVALGLRLLGGGATAGLAVALGSLVWKHGNADFQNLQAANALARGKVDVALQHAAAGLKKAPGDAGLLASEGRTRFAYESWLSVRDELDNPPSNFMEEDENEDSEEESPAGVEEDQGPTLGPAERIKLYGAAAEAFRGALAIQPEERQLKIELAKAVNETGNSAEAERLYVAAIRLDPANGYAYGAYGDFLAEADRTDHALRIYTLGAALPGGGYCEDQVESIREDLASSSADEEAAPAPKPAERSPQP